MINLSLRRHNEPNLEVTILAAYKEFRRLSSNKNEIQNIYITTREVFSHEDACASLMHREKLLNVEHTL
jgi:hypothetical protein